VILVADIQRAFAREHGIDPAIMREPDGLGARKRPRAWARQEAMHLALMLTPHSTVRIGQFFGGRDHSTVIEADRRVAERRRRDPDVQIRVCRVAAFMLREELR
jgi:chromosomal replication initiator protein